MRRRNGRRLICDRQQPERPGRAAVPHWHGRRRDIKRLPGQLATDFLAQADNLRFQRTCSRPAGFRFAARHGMWHAMHVNTGYAGYIRAHVGMQQRRHALQQGEQRYQDRMADFHR